MCCESHHCLSESDLYSAGHSFSPIQFLYGGQLVSLLLLGGNSMRTAGGGLPGSILVAGVKQTEGQNHSRNTLLIAWESRRIHPLSLTSLQLWIPSSFPFHECFCLFLFFKTGFYCVALAILELTL